MADTIVSGRLTNMIADSIAKEYSEKVRTALGAQVREIILFGSRARGEQKKYSDYDVLIIVDKRDKSLLDTVVNIEVDILDSYDRLIGSIVYEPIEWERKQHSPLGMNIRRDGITL